MDRRQAKNQLNNDEYTLCSLMFRSYSNARCQIRRKDRRLHQLACFGSTQNYGIVLAFLVAHVPVHQEQDRGALQYRGMAVVGPSPSCGKLTIMVRARNQELMWIGHMLLKKEASTVYLQQAAIMERSLVMLYYNLQVSWDIFFCHLVADTVANCKSLLPWLSSAVTGNRHAQMCFVVSSR